MGKWIWWQTGNLVESSASLDRHGDILFSDNENTKHKIHVYQFIMNESDREYKRQNTCLSTYYGNAHADI